MADLQSTPQEIVLQEFLRAFPEDAAVRPLLCNKAGYLLGFDHAGMLAQPANFTAEDELPNIRRPYVWLSSYYFLLDSVIDGHSKNRLDALYLTHLLTLSVQELLALTQRLVPTKTAEVCDLMCRHTSRNATAVRIEKRVLRRSFS